MVFFLSHPLHLKLQLNSQLRSEPFTLPPSAFQLRLPQPAPQAPPGLRAALRPRSSPSTGSSLRNPLADQPPVHLARACISAPNPLHAGLCPASTHAPHFSKSSPACSGLSVAPTVLRAKVRVEQRACIQCGSPPSLTIRDKKLVGHQQGLPCPNAKTSSSPADTLAPRAAPSPLPSLPDLQLKLQGPDPMPGPDLSPHHRGQGLASGQGQQRLGALRVLAPLQSSATM